MPQDVYTEMATKIIGEQQKIIGPVAYSQAMTVQGLTVNGKDHTVLVTGANGAQVINMLIESYKDFFGEAALEVCKEAVGQLRFTVAKDQLPESLR